MVQTSSLLSIVFAYLAILTFSSFSIGYDSTGIGNVVLIDETRTKHYLTAIAKHVGVMITPLHWTTSWTHSMFDWAEANWFYDSYRHQLSQYTNTKGCLSTDPDLYVLRFENCSSHNQNQAFVYDHKLYLLFWINPATNAQHPVYLEKDCTRIIKTVPMISRNAVSRSMSDHIRRFAKNISMNAHKHYVRMRALTLYSLQRAMPQLSDSEYQKYMGIIGTLNDVEFDYFLTENDDYLIADGHTVSAIKKEAILMTNKYHGLWRKNERNQLMHFLSGKYLQAVTSNQSRNILILENMVNPRQPQQTFEGINGTFYDLELNEYSEDMDNTFVTVRKLWDFDGKHEMYIHNDGQAKKIQHDLLLVHGADVLLAFVQKSTFEQTYKILRAGIHSNHPDVGNLHGK